MARPSPQTDRVVALIGLLSSETSPTLSLAEATRRLGTNKSTCHSMLAALQASGWLVRDPATRAYRLGPALIAVGQRAADGLPTVALVHPVLDEFAHRYGAHGLALAIAGDRGTLIDQVRDLRSTSAELPPGEVVLRPPLGSLVYAWAGEDEVEAWLAGESAESRHHHRAVLAATRRRGWSIELTTPPETRLRKAVAQLRHGLSGTLPVGGDGDTPSFEELVERLVGELSATEVFHDALPLALDPDEPYLVSSLSAPVFDATGRVALTVSLLGFPAPVAGAELARIGDELAAATAGVTRRYGGRHPAPEPAVAR